MCLSCRCPVACGCCTPERCDCEGGPNGVSEPDYWGHEDPPAGVEGQAESDISAEEL